MSKPEGELSFEKALAELEKIVGRMESGELSLEQALRSAEAASEEVAIARAGVMRSEGEHQRARSEYFPQVFGSVSFTPVPLPMVSPGAVFRFVS